MRHALGLATALLLLLLAPAAHAERSITGTWAPPPGVNGNYRITNTLSADELSFSGRVTSAGLAACAVDRDQLFWQGQREGAFSGAPTFRGTTIQFNAEGCDTTTVEAVFWPVADDRLRVCPGQGAILDTQSPVDGSARCTDFRRDVDPPEPKKHKASDYIWKFKRSPKTRCPGTGPATYLTYIRRVEDDPAVRFTMKVHNQTPEVVDGNVPNASRTYSVLKAYSPKRAATRVKVTVFTQSGRKFTRKSQLFPKCGT